MLYEVITIDSAKYCLSQIHKKELLKKHSSLLNLNIAELYEKDKQYHQAIHYYQKAEADRITSYNVCYTKLLRHEACIRSQRLSALQS